MNPNSPLSCCRPKNEQSSPLFRQQYVNQGGKVKLTMPLSPMHYLTNANGYINDMRYPPLRWENNTFHYPGVYDYPVPPSDVIKHPYDFDFKERFDNEPSYNTRKAVTPTMSFVAQPKRQTSAHYVIPSPECNNCQVNGPNIEILLASVNEKLLEIMKKLVDVDEKVSRLEKAYGDLAIKNKVAEAMNEVIPQKTFAQIHNPQEENPNHDDKLVKNMSIVSQVQSELKDTSDLVGKYLKVNHYQKSKDVGMRQETLNNRLVHAKEDEPKSKAIGSGKNVPAILNGNDKCAEGTEELALAEEKNSEILEAIERRFKMLIGSMNSKSVSEDPKSKNEICLPGENGETKDTSLAMKPVICTPPALVNEDVNPPQEIKDLNLTDTEIKYLEDCYEKETEDRLTCDLVPETRTDFETIIKEDSLCGMNTMEFCE
ncbi:hypothetical protein BEWA_023860 [Theileria equi strain WA]|uniref:Uncharacterized protein n=1 Tax=Theileria equi strain WA TaxID=1537102 RepID=L0AV99_THEEQ|nr:hypothetical protein BEWA_023860 [Theileria equi strain WA]AFZ79537.1 hypothetical protein BEWA_023860 [Theileria equi strain WA]|eukprot:XP_004829203.1 hypothetical protein BEWA_023860 [Theileria equi strain WA]